MTEPIANRVHEQRSVRGVTQQQVADGVGVSRQTVVAIEKGNYMPSVGLALKLADYFNTNVETLFYYESN